MKAFATRLAKKAGRIMMRHYGKLSSITAKDKESYVTNVDLEINDMLIKEISKKYPTHNIISEEAHPIEHGSNYTWYLDPVDGTHNYINQLPLFGVSIAVGFKGKIVLGVIYVPFFKDMYVAVLGKGAFCNGKKLKLSRKTRTTKPNVITDMVLRHHPQKKFAMLNQLKKNVYDLRVLGCAVYGLIAVADSKADAYITMFTNSWDIAAGALIVEEAGGKASMIDGSKWKPQEGAFIFSNGKVHNHLVKALRNVR